jgi:hypothetical protein
MVRVRILAVVLIAALSAYPAIARGEVSATVAAAYRPAERSVIAGFFIGAVKTWLKRYEHKVLTSSTNYVKMQVRYDYVYTLELTVGDGQYEIKVTGSDRSRGTATGQRNAVNLANGILERMQAKQRGRDDRNDRWKQTR